MPKVPSRDNAWGPGVAALCMWLRSMATYVGTTSMRYATMVARWWSSTLSRGPHAWVYLVLVLGMCMALRRTTTSVVRQDEGCRLARDAMAHAESHELRGHLGCVLMTRRTLQGC